MNISRTFPKDEHGKVIICVRQNNDHQTINTQSLWCPLYVGKVSSMSYLLFTKQERIPLYCWNVSGGTSSQAVVQGTCEMATALGF
jgi:hypothetical protein